MQQLQRTAQNITNAAGDHDDPLVDRFWFDLDVNMWTVKFIGDVQCTVDFIESIVLDEELVAALNKHATPKVSNASN